MMSYDALLVTHRFLEYTDFELGPSNENVTFPVSLHLVL